MIASNPFQILLQQSMDGLIEAANSSADNSDVAHTTPPKEPCLRNQKRVHFSTQNSMVQVPRSDCSFQSIVSMSVDTTANAKDQSFSYESVYSNEYEPIGSENNSSHLYVDMESKMGQEDRPAMREKIKTPPALPPKPANLMKLRQVLKIAGSKAGTYPVTTSKTMLETTLGDDAEPDYCSILEVNDAIKNVQVVVDVHKNADEMSTASEDTKTDLTDESFADIPKLPNVAAILSPKKEVISQFIAQDNYITKSPTSKLSTTKQLPNILAEINRKKIHTPTRIPKMSTITESKAIVSSPSSVPILVNDDKMPMQAEFDWYNLDAEYGKAHIPPDLVRDSGNTNGNGIQRMDMNDSEEHDFHELDELTELGGIEYNLDEEFSKASSPNEMLIINNENNENVSHIKSYEGNVRLDRSHKTFESFLNDTGLTSKPLPRKRKIFYSAPFV